MHVNFLSLAVSLSVAVSSFVGTVDATKTIRTKVAILGGGVSGISAARNLTHSGIDDFVIVEARHILGGIYRYEHVAMSVRAQDAAFAGTRVELGCNWVQGLGTNPINELRKKYKLKTGVTKGEDVVFYNEHGKTEGKKEYDRFNEAYEALSKLAEYRLNHNMVDISVRTGLEMVGWKPQTPVEKAVEYYVFDWEAAENPEVSSSIYSAINDNATYNGFGPGSDGDLFVLDKRGFKYPFIQEANQFLKKNDHRLKLNTKVTKIEYSKKGVRIHTDQDEIIIADYAITTFSLGVLQNDDVKWSPPFPSWKKEGLSGFHMATYTKIFMNFPYQFWDDNQFTVYADPGRRGYYNAWQNLNAPGFYPKNTTTNIFFVTVTQDQSYAVESMTDEEVKDEIMDVLRSMYGDDVPEPNEFLFPRWHSNPLFRGTYSNWPIGELGQHHINMKAPLHNRVFFAGEAMHDEEFGFLQGAWLSGEETAANVAQCIKSKCAPAKYFPVITNAKLQPNFIRKRGFTPGYI
ncbi:hypothetical protein EC973_006385 [Apophysomyces ossiformis]|uniref:Amine oxidase domain-containing protein n=1 Tax=Apophysomyces ossiformis TaxID=679940 RepID=A0A8H7BZ06_9FUNG|nr:hypothetical protein EC973_006385 [Apophysomyces ossiformis]